MFVCRFFLTACNRWTWKSSFLLELMEYKVKRLSLRILRKPASYRILRLRDARVCEMLSACITSHTQHSRFMMRLMIRMRVSSERAKAALVNSFMGTIPLYAHYRIYFNMKYTLCQYSNIKVLLYLLHKIADCYPRFPIGQTVLETAYKLGNGHYIIKEPKTLHSRRTVTLPPSLVELFKTYRADQELLRIQLGVSLNPDDFVFIRYDSHPINPNTITLAFRRIIKKAGLKRIRIHDLRHTHATLMLKAGVHPKIVSEHLGHSSITVTLDTYSHVAPGLQEAAAVGFDKMVLPKREGETVKIVY